MNSTLTHGITLCIGIMLGWLLVSKISCNLPVDPVVIVKDTTVYVDVFKDRPIPKPYPVYVDLSKQDTVFWDTAENQALRAALDSLKSNYPEWPVDLGDLRINEYRDSINTDDFNLKYQIKTLGTLVEFSPTIEVFPNTITVPIKKNPKFSIGLGVSNRLNYKVGFGYRGWMLEGEFKKGFNQVYLTKQFYLK